jgi:hypothetical protein
MDVRTFGLGIEATFNRRPMAKLVALGSLLRASRVATKAHPYRLAINDSLLRRFKIRPAATKSPTIVRAANVDARRLFFTDIYRHRIFVMLRDRAHARFFGSRTNPLFPRTLPHNLKVAGSNPAPATTSISRIEAGAFVRSGIFQ